MSSAKPKVVVSSCLLGNLCRYDGQTKQYAAVREALQDKEVIPVCPEQFGGLPTPRPASEFVGGTGEDLLDGHAQIFGRDDGENRTDAFLRGAHRAFDAAQGAQTAILKARSPSCGFGETWREGQIVEGHGVFAAMLVRAGVVILTDEDVD